MVRDITWDAMQCCWCLKSQKRETCLLLYSLSNRLRSNISTVGLKSVPIPWHLWGLKCSSTLQMRSYGITRARAEWGAVTLGLIRTPARALNVASCSVARHLSLSVFIIISWRSYRAPEFWTSSARYRCLMSGVLGCPSLLRERGARADPRGSCHLWYRPYVNTSISQHSAFTGNYPWPNIY
jgi:hypothetical protein